MKKPWQRLSVGRVVALACGSALAATAPCASAQDSAPAVKLEKVQVTGSHIPQPEIESALPVQIITREDIERTGATTVSELMARVSANILGDNDRISSQPGLSSINLRGIGSGSTLVLLNGRRVANYAFDGGAVDVNSIPLSVVDRVEILKDGASAIYGTDAIAGVVNIILRRDFRGFELTGYGAWTEHGGGNQKQVILTAGYGDLGKDRFNAFVTATYQKNDALAAIARPFSRTGYLPDQGVVGLNPLGTFPANIFSFETGGLYNPSYASGCAPPSSLPATFDIGTGPFPACGFDFAPFTNTIPPAERAGAFGRATLRLDTDHQLFAEAGYQRNKFTFQAAPTPVSFFQTPAGTSFHYPEGGPYYPTEFAAANGLSGDLELFYRTVPLGPRVEDVTTSAWRAVVGAEGLLDGWSYTTGLAYSRNEQSEVLRSGYVSAQGIVDAMATGLVNPFGPSGPEGDALLAGTQRSGKAHWATGTTLDFDFSGSKEVYALPAGPLSIALGGGARREHLENRFADFIASGDVIFSGVANQVVAGSRSVQSAFVEAIVPVVQSVEAQLAARYDHYGDFGDTTNPKIALRWQPMKTLLLRGSWGTGFRAPTLYDLFTPQQQGGVTGLPFDDPVRCPVTHSPQDCSAFYPTLTGGNPQLQPETSEQVNAGIVVEPLRGLSLAVDYWKINKNQYIGTINGVTVFANFAHWAPTNIVRGPVDPAFPDLPGPIKEVVLVNQNLGHLRTWGIDVGVKWRGAATPLGRFGFALDGTYIIEWKLQPDGLTYVSGVGRFSPLLQAPFPRWRHHASLDWDYGPWGTTLAQTYQSGYGDLNYQLPPEIPANRVSSYEVWDVQARYTGFKNTAIALGVKNLMDRAPPFTNAPNTGWDPIYADPRGRMFYARLTYAFE
jgi:iron complex outermembrane receptor protein